MIYAEIILILLLLTANGLFAMTEMAVVSSRKTRLRLLADQGQAGAAAALRLAEAPDRFLPTVQIGITLAGLVAGVFGGATIAAQLAAWLKTMPGLGHYAEPLALMAVIAALTFLSLVLGELAPKRLALASPERIAVRLALPMEWLSRLARPLVRALALATDAVLRLFRARPGQAEPVSDDELQVLMQEGARAGIFHRAEPAMVRSVVSFDLRPVTDIMTPRPKVVTLHRDETQESVWHKVVVSGHSQFPVHEGNVDRVIGVVSVKAIYANLGAGTAARIADLMLPPLFVPAQQTVMALLEAFKATGRRMGIVQDPAGTFIGLVTLVDVLEAVVGEIPSLEERLKPEALPRGDGSWLVDGHFDFRKLLLLLGEDAAAMEIPKTTVAAFAGARLKAPAHERDCFSHKGWRYEILDMDGSRIDKVLVTREGVTP